MSGYFECPWCGHEHNGYDMFDVDGIFRIRCDSCHKPIVVDVEIEVNVEVDKDKTAMAEERMKYEKRMRGDWS